MDIHKNARLTFIRREQLVQQVLVHKVSLKTAAIAFSVCSRTAAKWTRRYQQEGSAGLRDRSSRPHRSPRRTGEAVAQRVEQVRLLVQSTPNRASADLLPILPALAQTRGRIEGPYGAAALLAINPHTLRARMRKLGVQWRQFRKPA